MAIVNHTVYAIVLDDEKTTGPPILYCPQARYAMRELIDRSNTLKCEGYEGEPIHPAIQAADSS